MHELLMLTKSGREIKVGLAQTPDEVKALSEAAKNLLGGLKNAETQGGTVTVEFDGNTYFVLPTEIEGFCLYRVDS